MPRGDRLEVEQRIAGSTVTYLHHGIDIGDGTVVHARPRDFRNPFGGGHVVRTSMADFAGGRPVRVCSEPPAAFSADEVTARALAHVGRDGYHPVIDNCEHFATWCATGRRASRQIEIVMGRVAAGMSRAAAALSARAAVGSAERLAVRTAVGTTVRLGLKTLVPAAILGEAAAFTAEWTAHQRGAGAEQSRKAGEAAGLTASSVACAVAGATAGPAGVFTGALAGAALWLAGSATAAVASRAVSSDRNPTGRQGSTRP
jgi:hypothetical protein